jgi:hypothetical protein
VIAGVLLAASLAAPMASAAARAMARADVVIVGTPRTAAPDRVLLAVDEIYKGVADETVVVDAATCGALASGRSYLLFLHVHGDDRLVCVADEPNGDIGERTDAALYVRSFPRLPRRSPLSASDREAVVALVKYLITQHSGSVEVSVAVRGTHGRLSIEPPYDANGGISRGWTENSRIASKLPEYPAPWATTLLPDASTRATHWHLVVGPVDRRSTCEAVIWVRDYAPAYGDWDFCEGGYLLLRQGGQWVVEPIGQRLCIMT